MYSLLAPVYEIIWHSHLFEIITWYTIRRSQEFNSHALSEHTAMLFSLFLAFDFQIAMERVQIQIAREEAHREAAHKAMLRAEAKHIRREEERRKVCQP